MVILSCTPPPGAQPFSQVSHRAVTAVQKETSSHAFQIPWHIQEGAGKKTKTKQQKTNNMDIQVTLEHCKWHQAFSLRQPTLNLVHSSKPTNSASTGPSENPLRAAEPWPHEPGLPQRLGGFLVSFALRHRVKCCWPMLMMDLIPLETGTCILSWHYNKSTLLKLGLS